MVDAAGVDRFALLGVSQGAAIAVAYAARHPDRVTDLVLYGGYARGRRLRGQEDRKRRWSPPSAPAGRRPIRPTAASSACSSCRAGRPSQMRWYDDLLRTTTTVDAAVELFRARGAIDVVATAPQVDTRTLVLHARGDLVVPVEEGRLLGTLHPRARLVLLDSTNHILLADEPAWEQFVSLVGAFLGTSGRPVSAAVVGDLSAAELEVLELVAAGLTNEAIARAAVRQRPHRRAAPLERVREAPPLGQVRTRRGGRIVRRAARGARPAPPVARVRACRQPRGRRMGGATDAPAAARA